MSDEGAGTPLPSLETPRLILRPVSLRDADAVQANFNDWEVIRHLSLQVPWPYPEDGARQFISEVLLPAMAKGNCMCWALVEKEGTDEAIGLLEYRCGANASDHRGFWLGRQYWGKGYMTEAVTAFQDYVFFELGVDELVLHNAKVNTRSHRIKEKTGARFVQLVSIPHHEGVTETEQWVVTREAWGRVRGRAVPRQ